MEPKGWGRLHVGVERGVNCEHHQTLVTSLLQKHWETQENMRETVMPGAHEYTTMYLANVVVRTAFDFGSTWVDHCGDAGGVEGP